MRTLRKIRGMVDDLIHLTDIEDTIQLRTICGDAAFTAPDYRQVFDDRRAIGCRECRTAAIDWILGR